MTAIREVAKSTPGLRRVYSTLRRLFASHEAIFTAAYRSNRVSEMESVSGPGSELGRTELIVRALPMVFAELGVSTILDIPCGDCHWMSRVDMKAVNYIGADVVQALVKQNARRFEGKSMRFLHVNLIVDDLPQVDLVLCRDCLVHFSFSDIFKALRNICRSRSTYLLTTTFPSSVGNQDILTGQWRPLNLEVSPFCLPKPLRIINEGGTGPGATHSDKSLGLWLIEEVKQTLTNR